ncbi:MAG: S-layer homology domain-containing protein [Clostridiales bacterium]|jgi:phosphate transport system substrate-binding protein|nr:S-layer homology domain-containing protein [Clostridiales bacterium]
MKSLKIMQSNFKQCIAFMLSFCMLVAFIPKNQAYEAPNFSDVNNHWAKEAILDLAERGVINGMSDDSFEPELSITRAQMVTILNKAFPQANQPLKTSSFSDVTPDKWYYSECLQAYSNGLINGIWSDYLGADEPITRVDACVMVTRWIEIVDGGTATEFVDDASIPEYGKSAVYAMVSSNILNGYPDGSFGAKGNLTRAEGAAICKKTITYKESTIAPTPSSSSSPSGGGGGGETSVPLSTYKVTLQDLYTRLDGSTVTEPLTEALAAKLLNTDANIAAEAIKHNKTYESTKAVIDGGKDLAIVTYPSDENLAYAKSKGVDLTIVPIVNDAFVFLVNGGNSIQNLTAQNVKDIYSNKINTWGAFGLTKDDITWDDSVNSYNLVYYWDENTNENHKVSAKGAKADMMIAPYQRNAGSGSQDGMLDFMGNTPISAVLGPEYQIAVMNTLIDSISDDDLGIGYSYLYYARDMYANNKTKVISLDGVEPTNANIENGTYPNITPYYAVFKSAQPQDSFARSFVQYALSANGQKIAEDIGYVKLGSNQSKVLPNPKGAAITPTAQPTSSLDNIYKYFKADNSLFAFSIVNSIIPNVSQALSDSLTSSDNQIGGLEIRSADAFVAALPAGATAVAKEPYVISVNGDVGVTTITQQQFKSIIDGTYTNWNQLNGGNVPIRVYLFDGDDAKLKKFLNISADITFTRRYAYLDFDSDSNYLDNFFMADDGAITFNNVHDIAEVYGSHALKLENKSISDAAYSFYKTLYITAPTASYSDFATQLISIINSSQGKTAMKAKGFLPVNP